MKKSLSTPKKPTAAQLKYVAKQAKLRWAPKRIGKPSKPVSDRLKELKKQFSKGKYKCPSCGEDAFPIVIACPCGTIIETCELCFTDETVFECSNCGTEHDWHSTEKAGLAW